MWYVKVLVMLVWFALMVLFVFRKKIFKVRNGVSEKYNKKDEVGNQLLEVFTFQKNNPLNKFGFLSMKDGLSKLKEVFGAEDFVNIGFAYAKREFMEILSESENSYSIRLCYLNSDSIIDEGTLKDLTLNQLERVVELYYTKYDTDIIETLNNLI